MKIKQKIIEVRYKTVYQIVRNLVKPYLRSLKYKWDKPRHFPKPTVVLANHNTDYDPALVSVAFKDQMFFLASENCFRKGNFSKFLVWGFNPISKIKGASDTLAVMKAIRCLKEGNNVCIFPEGGRSFTGITNEVQVATGKFVKISGANLVTFKVQGGYLKVPRWGFGRRNGPWNGKFVNFYTSEQLKNMTPEEITANINKDLYENAYETQAAAPKKYSGENLAVGMECAVCVCPECKTIGNIHTEKDDVFCSNCNLRGTIGEYSFFDDKFPFHSVADWDLWQEKYFNELILSTKDENAVLFSDENVNLRTFDLNHNTEELGTGAFSLTKKGFVFSVSGKDDVILPIADIPDASVFSRSNFNFTNNKNGLHYELYASRLFNVRKYLSGWKLIRASLN